ncbi:MULTISPECIES: ABC transporter permease [Microbacterium]|uniref:ABC transporter permease n=1 Tax=Microbacterium TaxID=33882 RepID=UPI0027834AF5|nr:MULTISPECIES: ABC transporter permease [Microbacterium]MDQ1083129.1 multidrug/hemolysin transport system permease protein [Microbacterium sp. SORGH_AS_0344]MDQ1171599.1 multidrug/hemolysin transport system permease protein [Microbacterium proteolyticum]
MRSIAILTGRNLRLFFRDRAGVFFSLLSALILIALYALFLGNLQVDNLTERFPNAESSDIPWFVNAWVFAGITMITTLTTALAALTVFVDDRASGRFSDFLVSPVRRVELILGYLLSSFVISLTMTLVILVVGQVYLFTQGSSVMTASEAGEVLASVALSSVAFAAMSSFVVTFLRSSGAFAALSTVVGTIIGFLAGAYIPVGTLPDGIVNGINALPFAQAAMLIRGPMTAQALEALAGGEGPAMDAVKAFYGISAHVGDVEITPWLAVAVLVVVFVVFAALGARALAHRIR